MSYLKISKKTAKILESINKGKIYPTYPTSGYYQPWGKKSIKNRIKGINESVDTLNGILKHWKKSRKDIFYKSKIANTKSDTLKNSWIDRRKKYWKGESDKAWQNIGLKTVQDVLGSKKKHQKVLDDLADNSKNWSKRWDAKYRLKEINEVELRAKRDTRRFVKSSPHKRHHKELKNMSKH
ncbi:MAG: hypothetical protein V2I33_03950, partial [Kangiellaceae bacterium]|nr:hypothetical protein [Kangiellaceae bacterium]